MIANLVLFFVVALVARADAPLPAPSDYTIHSLDRGCYAFLDAGKKQTTVFQAGKGAPRAPLWEMPGWFRVAALADDCDHLVVGFDGSNLLPLDYHKGQVMLEFYRRGKLLRAVRLDELISDFGKLRRTASHYYWGRYLGFDRQKRFLVETVEGRRMAFDAATGVKAAEAVSPR